MSDITIPPLPSAEPLFPDPQVPGFEWIEGTRQISGIGGGYERACRAMVSAGCKWWSDHPGVDPQFHGFNGVFGLVAEDNDDAKALSAAITAPHPDCTGAMHHAAVNHVRSWAAQFGKDWSAYQRWMVENKEA